MQYDYVVNVQALAVNPDNVFVLDSCLINFDIASDGIGLNYSV